MKELVKLYHLLYKKNGNNGGQKMFFGLKYVYLCSFYVILFFKKISFIQINMQISRFTYLTTGKKACV